jgi:hypothetical protein
VSDKLDVTGALLRPAPRSVAVTAFDDIRARNTQCLANCSSVFTPPDCRREGQWTVQASLGGKSFK